MNASKEAELWFEASLLNNILGQIPHRLKSWRDVWIQNSKLLRMLSPSNRDATDSALKLLGAISSKETKRRGKRAQMIGEQARKVRQLRNQFFKEYFRLGDPGLTNVKFQKWRKEFDDSIALHAKTFVDALQKEIDKQIARALAGHQGLVSQ